MSQHPSGFLHCPEADGTITIIGYEGAGGEVTIPSEIHGQSVTCIGDWALVGCDSLTSVTIPISVTSIMGRAFDRCTNLTSVKIAGSVTSIGEMVFRGCNSLQTIVVDAANVAYCSLDGVLFNKDRTRLLQCPGAKTGNYSIPESVATIELAAFWFCPNLTSVTIGSAVTSIKGSNIFGFSGNLDAILVSAENQAFSSRDGVLFNKGQTKLIRCPEGKTGQYTIPQSVTEIVKDAFKCSKLAGVVIPDGVEASAL